MGLGGGREMVLVLVKVEVVELWVVILGRDRVVWSSFRRCCGLLMLIFRRFCFFITLDF